jgi:hypothetical protein
MKKSSAALGFLLCAAFVLTAAEAPAQDDCRADCLTQFEDCSRSGVAAPECAGRSCIACFQECLRACAGNENQDAPAPVPAPAVR